jgi:hypothetical protein
MLGVKMAGFIWVIAVLNVIGLLFSWSGPYAHAQDEQTKQAPSAQNAKTEQNVTKESKGESYGWRKYKEKIEHNEKLITATSTIFIAAFTVLLAFATFFLWIATRNLVKDAKHNAETQLRAYIYVDQGVVLLEGRKLKTFVSLKNTGQTPAYDFTVVSFLSTEEAGQPFVPTPFEDVQRSKSIVGPGVIMNPASELEIPMGNESAIPAFKDGRGVIYLAGQARYTDAFKRSWILDFRMRSHAFDTTSNRWILAPTEEGNQETEDK